MARVIHIQSRANPPDEALSMDDASTRVDAYVAEAIRNLKAAGEAVRSIEDYRERVIARGALLEAANEAVEQVVESAP